MRKLKKIKRIKKNERIFYLLIIAILLILMAILLIRTHNNYNTLKSHRDYLRQPNPSIQDWMTIYTIERHFNISSVVIDRELRMNGSILMNKLPNESISLDRLPLKTLCKRNHLNCTEVIERLNSMRSK